MKTRNDKSGKFIVKITEFAGEECVKYLYSTRPSVHGMFTDLFVSALRYKTRRTAWSAARRLMLRHVDIRACVVECG